MQTETDETQRPPRPAQSAAAARVGGGVGDEMRCDQPAQSVCASPTDAACVAAAADEFRARAAVAKSPAVADGYRQDAARLDRLARRLRDDPTPTPAVADALARAEEGERMARIANVLSEFSEADAISLPVRYRVSPRFIADVRALAGQLARAEGERDEARAQNGAEAIVASGYMDERDRAIEEREELRARLAAAERAGEDVSVLRQWVWLTHGCVGLYGDDGEMQCSECGLDFKRDDVGRIGSVLHARAMQRAALPARPSTPAAEGA